MSRELALEFLGVFEGDVRPVKRAGLRYSGACVQQGFLHEPFEAVGEQINETWNLLEMKRQSNCRFATSFAVLPVPHDI